MAGPYDRRMLDSPPVRRILAVAVALLVAVAVVAVVVRDGDGDDPLLAGSRETSTTIPTPDGGDSADGAGEGDDVAPPDGGGDAPGAPPATDQAGGEVSDPAAPQPPPDPGDGGEDLGAPQDPGAVSPPRAGSYTHSYTRQTQDGSESGERTDVIEDKGESGGERRQSIRQERQEGAFTSDVAWRGDGLYVLVTTFDIGGQESTCDWGPDFKNLATPLSVGVTWSYATSCTVMFGTTPVKIDRTGQFEVAGLARIQVAGEVLDVWKIESVEETTFGAFGSSREEGTGFFSPPHGLVVKSEVRASGSGQGQAGTVTEQSELLALSPR